jgi:hypothetical protein
LARYGHLIRADLGRWDLAKVDVRVELIGG